MSDRSLLDRRTFLAGGAVAGAAAAVPAIAAVAGAEEVANRPRRRPNILLIVTDDHPKGTEWAIPAIVNLIGGNGVDYRNGYVTTPLCCPSRASIMSGQYAHNHGVRQNPQSLNLDQRSTVQRYLQEAGYRTGLFGKYLNRYPAEQAPPYFDEVACLPQPKYRNATWNINGTLKKLPGYTTTIVRRRTVNFLKNAAADGVPWFAYVAPYASHGPNTPEEKYANTPVPAWNGNPAVLETDKTDKPPYLQRHNATLAQGRNVRRKQLRTLRSVNDMFKAIRKQLVAAGQLDNTLIIFIGDNGFSWADHGWLAKSVPYAPAVRVPFYLSWPAGGFGKGKTDTRLVANIDIAPTILDAAGIKPDRGYPMDGRSLLRSGHRDRLLIEWWKGGPIQPGQPPTWASNVTRSTQYTEYYDEFLDGDEIPGGTGKVLFREFYDLAKDPYQLTNLLHDSTAATRRRLGVARRSAQLRRDRRCTGARCP